MVSKAFLRYSQKEEWGEDPYGSSCRVANNLLHYQFQASSVNQVSDLESVTSVARHHCVIFCNSEGLPRFWYSCLKSHMWNWECGNVMRYGPSHEMLLTTFKVNVFSFYYLSLMGGSRNTWWKLTHQCYDTCIGPCCGALIAMYVRLESDLYL